MKIINNNTPNINIYIYKYICIQQKFVLNDLRYHKNHFNLSTYINIYTLHVLKKRVMNYND